MKKTEREIGGYLEFENLGGQEYYPSFYKFNLARTAFTWFLREAGCRKIYLPCFFCSSMIDSARSAGFEISMYNIRADFRPDETFLPSAADGDEWLLINNSYGQLTDDELLSYKNGYGNIIADYTHAFFQKPAEGVPTLYSVRKFFGVPDGAYLSAGFPLKMPSDRDASHDRFAHILGRYEEGAGKYYQRMLETAHSYETAPALKMSPLTENILGGLPYGRIAALRMRNYTCLEKLLSPCNELSPVLRIPDCGPFVYPMLVKDGPSVRRKLAERKIFIPVYWKNVMADMPENSVEYHYAADILALPCDQRYSEDDMETVASAVLSLI